MLKQQNKTKQNKGPLQTYLENGRHENKGYFTID